MLASEVTSDRRDTKRGFAEFADHFCEEEDHGTLVATTIRFVDFCQRWQKYFAFRKTSDPK